MFGVGMSEMLVIAVVALLLFGAKRLPELARSLGKGLVEFKRAVHAVGAELEEDHRTAARRDMRSADPRDGSGTRD